MIDYKQLYEMLTYKRPAGSKAEQAFIARYLDGIPGITVDAYGNRILRIGESATMFSAHTDTVHSKGGQQKIIVDEVSGYIYKNPSKECLGADDATGIFIMLRMIEHNIPGLYVFHRAEELGGLGSAWIAENAPSLLDGIDRAIAFDRKGSHSVITHQFGLRCASDKFALSLATLLGGDYRPDPTGVFTDTANYMDLIPECTNLSVGYDSEHTPAESQDLSLLDSLIPVLLSIDWEALPVEREPNGSQMAANDSLYDAEIVKRYGLSDWQEAYDLACDDPLVAADLLFAAYRDTWSREEEE